MTGDTNISWLQSLITQKGDIVAQRYAGYFSSNRLEGEHLCLPVSCVNPPSV